MRIDLHVHIKRLSRCAKMDITSLVPQLLSHDIHGVCPLDHYYFTTDADIEEIRKISDKIKVFKGTEIHIRGPQGHKEDYILISSTTPQFSLKDVPVPELINFINKYDALIILAHPYRRRDIVDFDFNWFVPDAVEISSNHIVAENRSKIQDLAKKYGMNPIITSDAHKSNQIGKYYIDVPYWLKTCEELKWLIKTKRYGLQP